MSKIIISLVMTVFLVMSPIVGHFADQQTSLNSQESSYIDSKEAANGGDKAKSSLSSEVNTVNTKANTGSNFELIVKAEASREETKGAVTETSTEKPEQDAEDAQVNETTVQSQQTDKLVQAKTSSSVSNKPISSEQPKVSSKPNSEQKSAADESEPVKTSQPAKSEKSKAGVSPKPSAAPSEKATPKPVDPPKVPTKPETSNQKSTPSDNGPVFDTSKVNSGTIGVRYNNTSDRRVKLMIEKGDSRYTYNLAGDGSLETFPLQSGGGEYTVSIMENTQGDKYRYIMTEKVTVKGNDSNSAYLSSIQMINWNDSMAAIKKAKGLTSGVSSDEAKIKKIYNYVVSSIRYDYDKLANLPSTYVPVIDNTYNSKSGICYDFASLTAAMLRSVGVPAKLVMGYADGVEGYHSWNEVYMNGKWIVIDTSYDSQMRENGASYSMTKSKSKYKASKVY